jgi:CRISPR-associated protein Cmr4
MMRELALFLYTETSLHAGTGSTVSAVDLPIQRERTTRHPLVQGSGIKGALRSQLLKTDYEKPLFGPSTDDMNKLRNAGRENDTYAGALSVGDARIVLFPVRSLTGVFAYITCPMVLARVRRSIPELPALLQPVDTSEGLVTTTSVVTTSGQLVLEEFSFSTQSSDVVDVLAQWFANNALPERPKDNDEYAYWRQKLPRSLVILSDDDFTEFTVNSTEIVTRVRIDSAKKTVERGALWTQEALPSDTLLMSSVNISASRDGDKSSSDNLTNGLKESVPARIQVGGDETTGQGFVALRWW